MRKAVHSQYGGTWAGRHLFPSPPPIPSLHLSGTQSHGIVYKALPEASDFYTYADATFMNADKCKSMTGYVFLAGEGAITWNSRTQ